MFCIIQHRALSTVQPKSLKNWPVCSYISALAGPSEYLAVSLNPSSLLFCDMYISFFPLLFVFFCLLSALSLHSSCLFYVRSLIPLYLHVTEIFFPFSPSSHIQRIQISLLFLSFEYHIRLCQRIDTSNCRIAGW